MTILADDTVLRGARRIGAHLGIPPSTVRRLSDQGAIPTFCFPGETVINARVGSLKACLNQLEGQGVVHKLKGVAA